MLDDFVDSNTIAHTRAKDNERGFDAFCISLQLVNIDAHGVGEINLVDDNQIGLVENDRVLLYHPWTLGYANHDYTLVVTERKVRGADEITHILYDDDLCLREVHRSQGFLDQPRVQVAFNAGIDLNRAHLVLGDSVGVDGGRDIPGDDQYLVATISQSLNNRFNKGGFARPDASKYIDSSDSVPVKHGAVFFSKLAIALGEILLEFDVHGSCGGGAMVVRSVMIWVFAFVRGDDDSLAFLPCWRHRLTLRDKYSLGGLGAL
jgi:hypothetical protein